MRPPTWAGPWSVPVGRWRTTASPARSADTWSGAATTTEVIMRARLTLGAAMNPPRVLRFQSRLRQRRFADRKSTRLNSSHSQISYAVFCLKKKKKRTNTYDEPFARDTVSKDPEEQQTHGTADAMHDALADRIVHPPRPLPETNTQARAQHD